MRHRFELQRPRERRPPRLQRGAGQQVVLGRDERVGAVSTGPRVSEPNTTIEPTRRRPTTERRLRRATPRVGPAAEAVEIDPLGTHQDLPVHRGGNLVVARQRTRRRRPGAQRRRRPAVGGLPLEVEAERFAVPPASAEDLRRVVHGDAEGFEPDRHVFPFGLHDEVGPEPGRTELEPSSRKRGLVVDDRDERPSVSHERRPEPGPPVRREQRQPHVATE